MSRGPPGPFGTTINFGYLVNKWEQVPWNRFKIEFIELLEQRVAQLHEQERNVPRISDANVSSNGTGSGASAHTRATEGGSGVDSDNPKRSKLSESQREIIRQLVILGGGQQGEDDIAFQGKKFILPETVTLREGYDFLGRKLKEQGETTRFSHTFRYRPWDGAHGAYQAMKKHFGLVSQSAIQTFFGPQPPEMIDVITGPGGQTEQVPWGKIHCALLPNADIFFGGGMDRERGPLFNITVEAPRALRFEIQGFFRIIEEELAQNSIYRGKAFDAKPEPDFLDLESLKPGQVIYAQNTRADLEANLWAYLTNTQTMRELGESLKRSVVLSGPYGTGKSMTAMLTAQIATQHGWSFVQCRAGRDKLVDALQTAALYQPSVVFFEDVDTISDATDSRNTANGISQLLDLFDGVQAKGTEIIAVMTTNHVNRIHKGMLRPGRIDSLIEFGALDLQGHRELIESAVPQDKRSPLLNYQRIHAAFEDYLPAFVREAIGRAKRYAVARTGSADFVLETDDFVYAAEGLRAQHLLMQDAGEGTKLPTLDASFRTLVAEEASKLRLSDEHGEEVRSGEYLAYDPEAEPLTAS